MRRFMIAVAALVALSVGGCAETCEEACENFARVCEKELAAGSVELDHEVCVSSCEDNLAGCADPEARAECYAEAKTCAEAQACPRCG
ncbi:MAG: hypothetical protein ACOX6T_08530 [Myxococcales bacterium]|jgi:outer membrane lipoprotein SlyB